MADPAQIVADPDFLAASPQMKQAILAKHDPDFAAASPDMQARIVAKYGAGQRTGLISGADRVTSLPAATEATLSNPPGAMDYVKAGLRQAQETVLPTVGLIAGSAAAPVAAAAPLAAGALYATGKAVNRFGQNVADMVYPANPNAPRQQPTAWDEAKQIGSDVMEGATLDMLPPTVMQEGRRGMDVLKGILGLGAPTAETMAVRAAAQRQGIDLPAGVASSSTPVSAIESFPGRFPIGRQASQPTYDRLALQTQRAAERVQQHPTMGPASLEQAGLAVKRDVGEIANAQTNAPTELVDRFSQTLGRTPQTRIEAGQQLSAGMQTSQRNVRAQAEQLYQAARSEAPPDATVTLTTAGPVASQIVRLEGRLGALGNRTQGPAATVRRYGTPADVQPHDLPDEAISDLLRAGRGNEVLAGTPMPVSSLPQDFVQRYGLDQPQPVPLDLAIELAKRARAMMRATTNDVEKGQFRAIANALSEDIGQLTPGLQRAGQFYRDEVARDFAPKSFIRRLIDLEPGRIAETVLTAQPDKVAAIMRQTPAAQRPMVQRMVFDKLRERSIDPRTGEIDPAKFESALTTYGEDNLRAVFGNRLGDLTAIRQTLRSNFGRPATPQGPGFGNIGDPYQVPMGAQAENVVNLMTRGRVRSLEDFDAIYNTVAPETQRQIRASTYDSVLRNSFDPASGVFSPQRFLTEKSKVPQEIWDRMLAADPAAALRDLEMVYRQIIQHARAVGNPSQTSHGLAAMTQLGSVAALAGSTAFGNEDPESFAKKALMILSPYIMGKAVFSGPGQRMLTSQPASPPNPNNPIATLGKALGVQLVR